RASRAIEGSLYVVSAGAEIFQCLCLMCDLVPPVAFTSIEIVRGGAKLLHGLIAGCVRAVYQDRSSSRVERIAGGSEEVIERQTRATHVGDDGAPANDCRES